MPTENRSSNTDMISVPRDLAEEICNGLRITQERGVKELRAILAQPAEQHQGEPVAWRFVEPGDEYNGYKQRVRVTLEKPSAVRARLGCEPLYTHADPGEVERLRLALSNTQALLDQANLHKEQRGKTIGALNTKLAELCGEVERLRAESIRLIEDRARFPDRPDDIGTMIGCHIGNLKNQAKSSEDYARKWRWELEAVSLKLDAANALLQEFCDRVDRGEVRSNKSYAKFKAHLSASAEPSAPKCGKCAGSALVQYPEHAGAWSDCPECKLSAPVERDERADFEQAYQRAVDLGWSNVKHLARQLWDARAALEHKPAGADDLAAFNAAFQKAMETGWDDPIDLALQLWNARGGLERKPALDTKMIGIVHAPPAEYDEP